MVHCQNRCPRLILQSLQCSVLNECKQGKGKICTKVREAVKKIFAKSKNGRFSVIPALAGSVVILGHFLMARTVPPSFVEIGPKLRVLIPLTWEWPKRAKNRGEPQKMTPSSETEIFWGWSEWESCSPGYTCVMLC